MLNYINGYLYYVSYVLVSNFVKILTWITTQKNVITGSLSAGILLYLGILWINNFLNTTMLWTLLKNDKVKHFVMLNHKFGGIKNTVNSGVTIKFFSVVCF